MARFGSGLVICLALVAILLGACEKNSEIKVYRVSKAPLEESAAQQQDSMPTNTAAPRMPRGLAATKLRGLFLQGNPMRELPSVIYECTGLEDIALDETPIRVLPAGIANLRKLWSLQLGGSLAQLPPDLGALPKLQYLRIQNSTLRTVPDRVLKMRSLKTLELVEPAIPEREQARLRTVAAARGLKLQI